LREAALEDTLDRLDKLVEQSVFPSRSVLASL
jgi:hypothetical protein